MCVNARNTNKSVFSIASACEHMRILKLQKAAGRLPRRIKIKLENTAYAAFSKICNLCFFNTALEILALSTAVTPLV